MKNYTQLIIIVICVALFIAALLASISQAAPTKPVHKTPYSVPEYVPPTPTKLSASLVKSFNAPEAHQGVAVDSQYFYAVTNTVIGKYDKETGEFIERWIGPKNGPITHINSCYAKDEKLWCANSNYPRKPMTSSVEVFNVEPLTHAFNYSLGMRDEGSLVWFDPIGDNFLTGFAHYNKKGGYEYKDNSFSNMVVHNANWQKVGGYVFPRQLTKIMDPYGASGGAIGPHGFLYVLGHDLPEMYVLAKPTMGSELIHIATIAVAAKGQAFAFDPIDNQTVWGIERHKRQVHKIELPPLSFLATEYQGFY